MLHNALHHPLAQPVSAVRFEHKHIAKIGDGREIADDTGKADLPFRSMINPEAQGVLDRTSNNLPRNSFCPIAIREESVDHIQVKKFPVRAQEKVVSTDFEDFCKIIARHFDILNCSTTKGTKVHKGNLTVTHSAFVVVLALRTPSAGNLPGAIRPYICRESHLLCSDRREAQRPYDPDRGWQTPPRSRVKTPAGTSNHRPHR